MSRRILVKVCGMREFENTQAILRLSPDLIGFIFVPDSKRYVEPSARSVLLESVPATVRAVGVFKDAEISELVDTVRQHHLSAVQLHGSEDSAYIAECRKQLPSCYLFKALSIGESAGVFSDLPKGVNLYIFDGARPGSGEGFDWDLLNEYRGEAPFFIAGGIGVHSLDRLQLCFTQHRNLLGIDINSKVELRVGVKDQDAVRQVIQGVRV
jgi:phosphoribosylanthranilate isomerase